MTQQVTTPEIEDVLASIRRLVADEPARYPAPKAGRLVLTPAQRVSPAEEDEGPLDLGEVAILVDADAEAEAQDDGAPAVEVLFAEGQGAEPPAEAIIEESAEAAAQEDHDALLSEVFDEAEAALIPEEEAQPAIEPRPIAEPEEGALSELDPASVPEEDYDASGQDSDVSDESDFEAVAPESASPQEDEVAASLESEAAQGDAPEEAAQLRPETLESKIAALEAVIGRSAEEFEPDGSRVVDTGPAEALPWEDHLAEAVSSELEEMFGTEEPDDERIVPFFNHAHQRSGRQPQSAPVPEQDGAEAGDAVLDEEALRALVGEIVRQELQGKLGERITRNVRKLVRREISRTLSEHGVI